MQNLVVLHWIELVNEAILILIPTMTNCPFFSRSFLPRKEIA